jgi:hypothetical protein
VLVFTGISCGGNGDYDEMRWSHRRDVNADVNKGAINDTLSITVKSLIKCHVRVEYYR